MSGLAVPEYRWLLPATLTVEPEDDGGARPVRRSTRDWIVDAVAFALVVGFALLTVADLAAQRPAIFYGYAPSPVWLLRLDLAAALIAAVALWWRRRWPVGVALALVPLSLFSVASAAALLVVLFSVAVHRRFVIAASVAGVHLLAAVAFGVIRPDTSMPYSVATVLSVVFIALMLLSGMFVRARRQLVVSLRDRAQRAESEQQMRVAQARVLERARIAREMHDVLAHRISLVSLHAGALEINPAAPAAEVARAAGVIRTSAHQALEDLREVIGVLRADGLDAAHGPYAADAAPDRPQPSLRDLPVLVDECRSAGVRITLHLVIDELASVPAVTARTAYRIIQEALTNARKHAPGSAVTVVVDGSADVGLSVTVRNPWPVGRLSQGDIPGAGTGLIGLAERTTLAGGRLRHGRTVAGDFELTAWLPWPK